jgi:hypothetical protein
VHSYILRTIGLFRWFIEENVSDNIFSCLFFLLTRSYFFFLFNKTDQNLLPNVLVSGCAGTAVVLVVTIGGAVNALIGTVISASLLPPIVNCGMCWAMAMKYNMDSSSNTDDAKFYAMTGMVRG